MSLVLDGTNGLSDVDGSAATPAIRGTDANTGIFFPAADTIAFAEGGAEAMRIDSSGNVGIGTSSPNERMTIASSTSGSYLQICDSSTGTASGDGLFIGSFNGAAEIKTKENNVLQFGTNNTERARIDTSGNLLVGKTATGDFTSGFEVQPAGAIIVYRNSGPTGIFGRTDNGELLRFNRSTSSVGSITVGTSTTAYNTSSDYRLKHDIAPMTGALAKVTALKPVTYKWNSDNSESQGFIAHELQEVVPECVTGEKDAVETYTDEDGVEQTRPKYQGVDTSFLVATLTAAIQELKAINDAQATTITALTARVEALDARLISLEGTQP